MNYLAEINIMPLKELLDPQGKAVAGGIHKLNIHSVNDVRIGKRIELKLTAQNEDEAREQVELTCKKLLANPVMESYDYVIRQVEA